MMGDYCSILAVYTEFAEKMDAFDESELTGAELAYYTQVTSRVSQKLLTVAGDNPNASAIRAGWSHDGNQTHATDAWV